MKKLLDYTMQSQFAIEYSDCFHATLYAIAQNIGSQSEFIPFLTFSNFKFHPHDLSLCFERSGIIQGVPDRLSELTGLQVKKNHYHTREELFDLCFYNSHKQIPTVLNIDTFDIPYHRAHKKEHLGHYFILLSLDANGHCIYMDPYFDLDRVEAQFYDLPIIYDHYLEYRLVTHALHDPIEIVLQQLNEYVNQGICKDLQNVAALLINNGAFERQINKQTPVLSHFMLKLKSFIVERKNLLYYLYQFMPQNTELIQDYEIFVKGWNDIYLLLLKCISRNYKYDLLECASNLINCSAEREELIMNKIKYAFT